MKSHGLDELEAQTASPPLSVAGRRPAAKATLCTSGSDTAFGKEPGERERKYCFGSSQWKKEQKRWGSGKSQVSQWELSPSKDRSTWPPSAKRIVAGALAQGLWEMLGETEAVTLCPPSPYTLKLQSSPSKTKGSVLWRYLGPSSPRKCPSAIAFLKPSYRTVAPEPAVEPAAWVGERFLQLPAMTGKRTMGDCLSSGWGSSPPARWVRGAWSPRRQSISLLKPPCAMPQLSYFIFGGRAWEERNGHK